MPRLLLVDDNPSIHRIAESLLTQSTIELVCVGSAMEALDRIQQGDRYDVALVDANMPGMDGWALLDALRRHPATARMPIALMAGVLDQVDQGRLDSAPIQGFLKKPIELRDLADRVKVLLETPVPEPASLGITVPDEVPETVTSSAQDLSPFSTVPSAKVSDLVRLATPDEEPDTVGGGFPEAEPAAFPHAEGMEELSLEDIGLLSPEPVLEAPAVLAAEDEDDLLRLEASDLWEEDRPAAAPEVELELEELDLDSLRGLAVESAPEPVSVPEPVAEAPSPVLDLEAPVLPEPGEDLDELALPEPEWSAPVAAVAEPAPVSLPEPEPVPEPVAKPIAELSLPAAILRQVEAEDLAPTRETPLLAPEVTERGTPAPESAPAGPLSAPVAPVPAPATGQAADPHALVQALLAQPELVELLARALVKQMGADAIKEIAWEVFPELAEKLRS